MYSLKELGSITNTVFNSSIGAITKLLFSPFPTTTLLFLYIFSEFLDQISLCSTYSFSSPYFYLQLLTQRCNQFLTKLIRVVLVLTAYQRNSCQFKFFRSKHHSVKSGWRFLLLFPFLPQTCETCRPPTQNFYFFLHSLFFLLQCYPVIPASKKYFGSSHLDQL